MIMISTTPKYLIAILIIISLFVVNMVIPTAANDPQETTKNSQPTTIDTSTPKTEQTNTAAPVVVANRLSSSADKHGHSSDDNKHGYSSDDNNHEYSSDDDKHEYSSDDGKYGYSTDYGNPPLEEEKNRSLHEETRSKQKKPPFDICVWCSQSKHRLLRKCSKIFCPPPSDKSGGEDKHSEASSTEINLNPTIERSAEHRRQNVPPPPPPIVDRPPIGQRNAQTNEPQLIINVPRTKEGLELRTPFADVRQWYHRNLSFLRVGFRKYINKTVPMDMDKTPSQRYRDYSVATKYCAYTSPQRYECGRVRPVFCLLEIRRSWRCYLFLRIAYPTMHFMDVAVTKCILGKVYLKPTPDFEEVHSQYVYGCTYRLPNTPNQYSAPIYLSNTRNGLFEYRKYDDNRLEVTSHVCASYLSWQYMSTSTPPAPGNRVNPNPNPMMNRPYGF